MLAEENKSAGPSALDGKPAEIFFFLLSIFFPGFFGPLSAFLFILRLSKLIGSVLMYTPYGTVMKI